MSELEYSNKQIDLVVSGLESLENFGDCVAGSKIIRQLQRCIEKLSYLEIPYFLRAPGAVEEDVKREFKKQRAEIILLKIKGANAIKFQQETTKNCNILLAEFAEEQKPLRARIEELEAGVKNIAPWLSASLTDHEHDGGGDYLKACNEIFKLDLPAPSSEVVKKVNDNPKKLRGRS